MILWYIAGTATLLAGLTLWVRWLEPFEWEKDFERNAPLDDGGENGSH